MRFQKFPVGDEHIESRMDEICDEIGEEYLNHETVKKESAEAKARERFLKSVGNFPSQNRWLTSKNTHRTAASSARISESSRESTS